MERYATCWIVTPEVGERYRVNGEVPRFFQMEDLQIWLLDQHGEQRELRISVGGQDFVFKQCQNAIWESKKYVLRTNGLDQLFENAATNTLHLHRFLEAFYGGDR